MLYGNLPTRETNKCQSLYKQGALLQLPKGCGSEAGCHIHVLVQGKSKTCPPDSYVPLIRQQNFLRLLKVGVFALLTSRNVVGNEITARSQRDVTSLKHGNTPPNLLQSLCTKAFRRGGCLSSTTPNTTPNTTPMTLPTILSIIVLKPS